MDIHVARSPSPNFITISHEHLPDRSPSPETELTATPTARRASYDLKRSAVPVACLRCRRRKVRCSGLPGPCVSCAKFGVACIDPGKRRSRSKSTSEARPHDYLMPQHSELNILHPTPVSPRPMQLHIQTNNLWDDAALQFDNPWNYPVSPACYSDIGPELDPNWPQYTPEAEPDIFSLSRAQTFPQQDISIDSQDLHSPIPSIQITSHDGSPMSSPMLQPAFDLPIRAHQDDLPPLQTAITTTMDYYSDYLSPTDAPPTLSRRASVAFSPTTRHVDAWTQGLASNSTTSVPTKRRHTTCSLSNPRTTESSELSWMLNSPRTTNYLTHYFTHIHPRYPFLPPLTRTHPPSASASPSASPFAPASSAIATYTRLLAAATGAMHAHRSRDIAARYVRAALALARREDLELFASVSGIHGAMVLAVYLLREGEMERDRDGGGGIGGGGGGGFVDEEEDTGHADVNLWLWNCRVMAGCVDLGLNQWEEGEPEVVAMCRETFRSAWVLDREISAARRRPRAWHEEDVDPRLVAWARRRECGERDEEGMRDDDDDDDEHDDDF